MMVVPLPVEDLISKLPLIISNRSLMPSRPSPLLAPPGPRRPTRKESPSSMIFMQMLFDNFRMQTSTRLACA